MRCLVDGIGSQACGVNMNILDLFGGGSPSYAGLLSDEDLLKLRRGAQTQGILSLANALLEAGAPSKTPQSTSLGLLKGVTSGMQGYQQAMSGGLQDALTIQKLQEAKAAKARQEQVNQLLPQLIGQQPIGTQEVSMGGMPAIPSAPTQVSPDMSMRAGMEPQSAMGALQKFYTPAAQMSQPVMGQVPVEDALKKLLAIGGEEGLKGVTQYAALKDVVTPERKTITVGNTVLDAQTLQPIYEGGEKPTSDIQNYNQAVAQGYKGSFMDYQAALKRAGATVVDLGAGQKGFENTTALGKNFKAEPVYKAHQEMKAARNQIMEALGQGTPIGDTAAATKIMKLLDPGSVVRESELGMAMAATGLLDRLSNYAQNIIKGTKLTTAQRKEFAQLGDALYQASVDEYNKKRGEYERLGSEFGLKTGVALGAPESSAQRIKVYNPATGRAE